MPPVNGLCTVPRPKLLENSALEFSHHAATDAQLFLNLFVEKTLFKVTQHAFFTLV
ncbi:MAG TPA: hypothetical protein VG146_14720 [Verrucomicrobiae bacterium]|nr:hypothetical protein [Verrucomicrobiae bacterium]